MMAWTIRIGAPLILLAVFVFYAVGGGTRERQAEKITVIGLNTLRQTVTQEVPADLYASVLNSAITSVHDSILPALEAQASGSRFADGGKTWQLRTIGVGVGLTGEIGLGPIISLSLSPRLRLVFTNSTDPAYPE